LAPKIKGEERAFYYVSKKFLEYEIRYSPLEKTTLILVWASNKLMNYMFTYTIHVVASIDPIKYLLQQPVIKENVARWTVMLLEFNLH